MFNLEKSEEKVQLEVQIQDGEVTIDGGTSLPRLQGTTKGTLTIPAKSLSEEDYERLTGETEEIILPAGHRIWILMKPRSRQDLPDFVTNYLENGETLPAPEGGGVLIPVTLMKMLWLRHRGTKNAEVKPCLCVLPKALQQEVTDDETISSLNQAYTRLSEVFEVHRTTHTGRIYTKTYVDIEEHHEWEQLDWFRNRNSTSPVWKQLPSLRPWWAQDGSADLFGGGSRAWATVDARLTEDRNWTGVPVYIEENQTRRGSEAELKEIVESIQVSGYRPFNYRRDDFRPPMERI